MQRDGDVVNIEVNVTVALGGPHLAVAEIETGTAELILKTYGDTDADTGEDILADDSERASNLVLNREKHLLEAGMAESYAPCRAITELGAGTCRAGQKNESGYRQSDKSFHF